MPKKYINELTIEQLKKVFSTNSILKDEIEEDMIETEMHYISEQMDYIRDSLSNWEIGAYYRCNINVNRYDEFILGMYEMDQSIPILDDKGSKLLESAVSLIDEYRNTDMIEEEEKLYTLDDEIKAVGKELENMLVNSIERILDYCTKEDRQLDYFIDFYIENRLDEYTYIEDDYILKLDITKTYK